MADEHFMIEKGLSDGRTVTNIYALSEEASIGELARLLGGDKITDAVVQNAQEMRNEALESKRS